ncbi:MAG TPA: L-histidine N(alpha)-methyltransferase [Blastocatellia bacterium]|nr:L-histidine N(alpha)-methyltransferase [Blastocatellia bacterium]
MASNTRSWPADRFVIHRLSEEGRANTFADDVRAGLGASPKSLPPKYFYDELGSRLFEAICCLPEYYLTRAEGEILCDNVDEIAGEVAGPVRLVELGSGSAEKTRLIIEALLRRQPTLHYVPVDISETSLERSSKELLRLYPGLRITAYAADYFTALGALAEARESRERTIALFLGSNVGNFTPDESLAFLQKFRAVFEPGDALLLGADLRKAASALVPAYDDALGVTAAFNLNLLVRMNRELGAGFDLAKFEHRAIYDEQRGRIEMHLVSRAAQTVRIESLGLDVRFDAGESIHTENSYKFDIEQLSDFAARSGFVLRRSWFDAGRQFSFNLFSAEA